MTKIFAISDRFSEESKTGIVMHRIRISACRPEVGSALGTLVLEGPIRNGVGQVGTGLGHVRTQEICHLFAATPGY